MPAPTILQDDDITQITLQLITSQLERRDLTQETRHCKLSAQSSPNLKDILCPRFDESPTWRRQCSAPACIAKCREENNTVRCFVSAARQRLRSSHERSLSGNPSCITRLAKGLYNPTYRFSCHDQSSHFPSSPWYTGGGDSFISPPLPVTPKSATMQIQRFWLIRRHSIRPAPRSAALQKPRHHFFQADDGRRHDIILGHFGEDTMLPFRADDHSPFGC